jgi:hypothetical protein
MIEALKAVLDGRLRREAPWRCPAAAYRRASRRSRAGCGDAAMLGQIGIAPQEMPTNTLADYLVALDRTAGLANAAQLRARPSRSCATRMVYEGTRIDLTDKARAPLVADVVGRRDACDQGADRDARPPGWQDDDAEDDGRRRRCASSAAIGIRPPANAWGTVAVRKFARSIPPGDRGHDDRDARQRRRSAAAWPQPWVRRRSAWRCRRQTTPLMLRQAGGAGPWAFVSVKAAVPLTQPLFAGYKHEQVGRLVQGLKGRALRAATC